MAFSSTVFLRRFFLPSLGGAAAGSSSPGSASPGSVWVGSVSPSPVLLVGALEASSAGSAEVSGADSLPERSPVVLVGSLGTGEANCALVLARFRFSFSAFAQAKVTAASVGACFTGTAGGSAFVFT